MAAMDVDQAVHQAARCLQIGMDELLHNSSSSSSKQPAAVDKLSKLAAAAAVKLDEIKGRPSVQDPPAAMVARRAAIAQAASTTRIASAAAAYLAWFVTVLISQPAPAISTMASSQATVSSSSGGSGGRHRHRSSSSSSSAAPSSQTSAERVKSSQQACAGFDSAVRVLQVVLPRKWPAGTQASQATIAAETATVDSVISPQPDIKMPGLPEVLQELNVWLNNSTANQEQQKHLILTTPLQQRLAAGACRLYHLLPKAATAAGHATSPVVLTLLADGLQLAMRLPQLYLWPFLDMVPRQLRIIAWSAERQQALKPELATLCWQQLVQNKDGWWLGLCAATAVLQQSSRSQSTAGPGWASANLVRDLDLEAKLDSCMPAKEARVVREGAVVGLLCAYGGLLVWAPVTAAAGPADGNPGARLVLQLLSRPGVVASPPTLLQLQALAEALTLEAAVHLDGTENMLLLLVLLLTVIVGAAELDVRSAFLGTIHFQQVLGVLKGLAACDWTFDMRLTPSPTASTAAAAGTAATAADAAAQKEGPLQRTAYTLSPQQLVVGLLRVMTMVPVSAKGQEGSKETEPPATTRPPGPIHVLDPDTPADRLGFAPGLQLSPPLWSLLECCLRAAGTIEQTALQLARRWVRLAWQVLEDTAAKAASHASSSGSSSRCASSSSSSSNNSSSSGIGGSSSGSSSSSADGHMGRGVWYASLGSLVNSMAKIDLIQDDLIGMAHLSSLVQLLLAQLANAQRPDLALMLRQQQQPQEGQALSHQFQQQDDCAPAQTQPQAAATGVATAAAAAAAAAAAVAVQQEGGGVRGRWSQDGQKQQEQAVPPQPGLEQKESSNAAAAGQAVQIGQQPVQAAATAGGGLAGRLVLLGALLRADAVMKHWVSTSSNLADEQNMTLKGFAEGASRDIAHTVYGACAEYHAAIQAGVPAASSGRGCSSGSSQGVQEGGQPCTATGGATAAGTSTSSCSMGAGHLSTSPMSSRGGGGSSSSSSTRSQSTQHPAASAAAAAAAVVAPAPEPQRRGNEVGFIRGLQQLFGGSEPGPSPAPTNNSSQGQQVGDPVASMTALPLFTAACGYPGCTNLSGPSEVTLVTNRGGVVCGGCGVVRYCSAECAASSWPVHGKQCKRLGAANKAYQAHKAAAAVAP